MQRCENRLAPGDKRGVARAWWDGATQHRCRLSDSAGASCDSSAAVARACSLVTRPIRIRRAAWLGRRAPGGFGCTPAAARARVSLLTLSEADHVDPGVGNGNTYSRRRRSYSDAATATVAQQQCSRRGPTRCPAGATRPGCRRSKRPRRRQSAAGPYVLLRGPHPVLFMCTCGHAEQGARGLRTCSGSPLSALSASVIAGATVRLPVSTRVA